MPVASQNNRPDFSPHAPAALRLFTNVFWRNPHLSRVSEKYIPAEPRFFLPSYKSCKALFLRLGSLLSMAQRKLNQLPISPAAKLLLPIGRPCVRARDF